MPLSTPFQTIAFDADDTLWVNEPLYRGAEETLEHLLAPYLNGEPLQALLYERERHNLSLFGYGAKGFTLSMIETAIELTGGQITGAEIQQIIETGKNLLRHPIQLLPHVRETLELLAGPYRLMLITKGDLFDQESKLARSGLADYFTHVEIVSEKNEAVYRSLYAKYGIEPHRFLMVGNSLKSDVLPVVRTGGQAVHIPYHTTWIHEQVDDAGPWAQSYRELESIRELPGLLAEYHTRTGPAH